MLEIKDLEFAVEKDGKDFKILKDINLSFNSNKIYVITGPNGSGKSTLAKLIMGIEKPTSGSILFDGKDITNMDITARAKMGIGYAFQNPPRFKGIKVKDLLEMSINKSADVCEVLHDVGLCAQDYLEREIDASLSGGELKRIEIASIIARDLKVAVFDEPEAGIDLWSFQRLSETFKKIHEKYDTTIIIISHQERIINLSDEVVLISEGKIKEITTKEVILKDFEDKSFNCEHKENCECEKGTI